MLKQLILINKRKGINSSLEALRKEVEGLNVREAELTKAIEEVTNDEERAVVTEEVESFEKDKADKESKVVELERQLAEIDSELEEIEKNKPAAEDVEEARKENKVREVRGNMNDTIRSGKFFKGMNRGFVDNLIEREDVKAFLTNVRSLASEKRAVTGAELGIPVVMLPLLREKVEGYSKLIKHINKVAVPGIARMPIMGTVPEAVWTEACAKLNELALSFSRVEVDGFKVGGYIDICTATLQDTDFNLADVIFDYFGQAVGLAVDKAILYGTDVKMPLGIVTRLAQATKPSDYPATAPAWVNLATSNILKTTAGKTGVELYSEIMGFAAAAKGKYSGSGAKFWAMNESTLLSLKQSLLSFNSNGALAADVSNVLPLIGGAIETLDFIPDGDVIGGYGQNYLLAERAGISLASSDIPRWYEDETSFKVTARYDGMPVIANAFVAFNIKAAAVTTTVAFPQDLANVVTP